MRTGGNWMALVLFLACIIWYASAVSLLALGQPLLALLVIAAGMLRPRAMPHLVAVMFTWPHLDIGFNRKPALGENYVNIGIGIVGLEWHPVCSLVHRLSRRRTQRRDVHVIQLDADDLKAGVDGNLDLDEAVIAALRRHLDRQFEDMRRQAEARIDDDVTR